MAHTTAHIVVDPSDPADIHIGDDGVNGGTITIRFAHGTTPVGSLTFHTAQGAQCDANDAVNSFCLWLDMLRSEAQIAVRDFTHGVGEQAPF